MRLLFEREKNVNRVLTLVACLTLTAAPALASEWKIDPAHSGAQFRVKHLGITDVDGVLGPINGTINMDDKDVTKSSVEVSIDVTQISTQNAQRDGHLKSPDFFDVAKFPTATFKSTKVEKAGKGKLKVTGDLTMHGITKPVTLAVEGPSAQVKDMMGGTRVALTATTKLNRKQWDLNWNKTLSGGELLVSDDVRVTLPIEATLEDPNKKAASAQ
jgi:polyisoprenoid-binding protein YceI